MPSYLVTVKTPSGLMPEHFILRLGIFGFIFEYIAFVFERNSFFSRIGVCLLDAASEEESAVDRFDDP